MRGRSCGVWWGNVTVQLCWEGEGGTKNTAQFWGPENRLGELMWKGKSEMRLGKWNCVIQEDIHVNPPLELKCKFQSKDSSRHFRGAGIRRGGDVCQRAQVCASREERLVQCSRRTGMSKLEGADGQRVAFLGANSGCTLCFTLS